MDAMVEVYVVCKNAKCKAEISLGTKMVDAGQTQDDAWKDYVTQTIPCQICGLKFEYLQEDLSYTLLGP